MNTIRQIKFVCSICLVLFFILPCYGLKYSDLYRNDTTMLRLDARTDPNDIDEILRWYDEKFQDEDIYKFPDLEKANRNSQWLYYKRKGKDFKRYSADINVLKEQRIKEIEEFKRINMYIIHLENLKTKLGGQITNEEERRLVSALIKNVDNPKDQKKMIKDFDKGKINKKLSSIIDSYINTLTKNMYSKQKDIKNLEYKIDEKKRSYSYNYEIQMIDTIKNPYYYPFMEQLYKENKMKNWGLFWGWRYVNLAGNWKWSWRNNENRVYKTDRYPVYVEYYYYPSHPDYKFINFSHYSSMLNTDVNAVFDSTGKLIEILYAEPYNDYYYLDKKIAAIAYQDNEYGIQSAPQSVRHHVKVYAGLEKRTKSEEAALDRAASQLAGAYIGHEKAHSRYGNSTKGKKEKQKYSDQAGKAVSSLSYSSDGYSWLTQIEQDYKSLIARGPYYTTKVNSNTFAYTYCNLNLEPILTVIVEYTSSAKPFNIDEKVTVKKVKAE